MFEGKNIHLSPIDGKPLCSFSKKLCRQRRLHGYAFCIRHILEDTNSPFKQCQFKTKSGETCINPVPITASRSYCNNHMHVMGLLPKPIKKITEKKQSTSQTSSSNKSNPKKITSKSNSIEKKTKERSKPQVKQQTNLKKTGNHSWSHTLGKALSNSRLKLDIWKAEQRSEVMLNLMKDKKLVTGADEQLSYRLDDTSSSNDTNIESFQCHFTTNHERVHHNVLREDDMNTQEGKLLSKLKHQYAQLRCVFEQKKQSGKLSYSILSKLTASARENSTETTNIIKHHLQDESKPRQIYHSRRDQQGCVVIPCCMIVGESRCIKPALPYTRYCSNHIDEDSEQLLFVPKNLNNTQPSRGTCKSPILRIFHTDNISQTIPKANNSDNSKVIKSKRNIAKKASHRKINNNKAKRTNTTKKLAAKNILKLKCIKEYGLSEKLVTTNKLKAHVRTDEPTAGLPLDLHDIGTPPVLSESSSSSYTESDSDSDILTPEEAFHLPPGSLSFPTGLDDDDALSGIHNSSRACDIADEEDELIRCGSNFTMDTDKQDMISRELSSPTLNQLTDFDPSLGMFLSRNESSSDLSSSTVAATSQEKSLQTHATPFTTNNLITMSTPGGGSIYEQQQQQQQQQQQHSNHNKSTTNLTIDNHYKTDTNSNQHRSKGSATTLKISPLNLSPRQVPLPPLGFTPNQTTRPLLNSFDKISTLTSSSLQITTTSMSTKPPIVNNTFTTYNGNMAGTDIRTARQTKEEIRSWNKQYMQIDNFCESDMLNDIAMDEETPLEKVNPDIFFSSAFPVSTSSADL